MLIKKNQWPIVVINASVITTFTLIFLSRQNYEILIYVGVILFFLILIILTNQQVRYPDIVLWGLTVWAFLHVSGGALYIGEKRLYELVLVRLVGAPYHVFRYDQFVHIVVFGVATLAMYCLLKPLSQDDHRKWTALSFIIIMAGLGVGAFHEIVEFIATLVMPETGVGGYENTALVLVTDGVGASAAMIFIRLHEK